jgi:hypothetical protein
MKEAEKALTRAAFAVAALKLPNHGTPEATAKAREQMENAVGLALEAGMQPPQIQSFLIVQCKKD